MQLHSSLHCREKDWLVDPKRLVRTKEKNLQFVCQGWSIDLNVADEDEEEADDDQDDLPAGVEASHGDALEVPDDDGHTAVHHCTHHQKDAGQYEHVLVSV